jgi:hypothetical protein
VQIALCDASGGVVGGAEESGEGGRFIVRTRYAGPMWVTATLLGVPRAKPGVDEAKVAVPADGKEVVIVVDRGNELLVAPAEGQFVRTHPGLDVGLLEAEGPQGRETYDAAVDQGRAAFRRIPEGVPWTLWIPWSESTKGTLYESGASLRAGQRTVTLEPGRRIRGHVKCDFDPRGYTHGGPPRQWVRAFRGPAEVHAWFNAGGPLDNTGLPLGDFEFRHPLASGTWRIVVYAIDRTRGACEAAVDVEAGAPPLVIEPVPVTRGK